MNEILRIMQKRDERTDAWTAFYNLPTTAFSRRREKVAGDNNGEIQIQESGIACCIQTITYLQGQ